MSMSEKEIETLMQGLEIIYANDMKIPLCEKSTMNLNWEYGNNLLISNYYLTKEKNLFRFALINEFINVFSIMLCEEIDSDSVMVFETDKIKDIEESALLQFQSNLNAIDTFNNFNINSSCNVYIPEASSYLFEYYMLGKMGNLATSMNETVLDANFELNSNLLGSIFTCLNKESLTTKVSCEFKKTKKSVINSKLLLSDYFPNKNKKSKFFLIKFKFKNYPNIEHNFLIEIESKDFLDKFEKDSIESNFTTTKEDFVPWLKGFLEMKKTLGEEEVSLLKEKLFVHLNS